MFLIRKIFFFLFFFLITYNLANSNENVVFIDLDFIFQNSNLGKSILTNLNKINKDNIQKLELKENNLKEQEDQIKKKQNVISADQFNKEADLFKDKIKIFRLEKDKIANEFTKLKKNQINDFFIKINPTIQEYMNEKSITIILDRKNVFLGIVTSDITLDILERINKNFN